MKLNFENQTFSLDGFLSQPSDLTLTPKQLQGWWHTLSTENKAKICTLNVPKITSELANIANSALLSCKLNPNYKKKELISSFKSKNDHGEVISNVYKFDFNGKELLEDSIAKLFSSFYVSINRGQKSPEGADDQGRQHQKEIKSCIGVKEESLNSIVDLLQQSFSNFADGEKIMIQQEDFSSVYSSLVNSFSQHLTLHQKLPVNLKSLLERLAVFSYLLTQNIYSAYSDAVIEEQEAADQAILNQLNNLSSLNNNMFNNSSHKSLAPLLVKTVSQVEREHQDRHQSHSHTTGDESPRELTTANCSQEIDEKEINQALSPDSPGCPVGSALLKPSNQNAVGDYSLTAYNIYDGLEMGNLEIAFDPTDMLLTEDEEDFYDHMESDKKDMSQKEYFSEDSEEQEEIDDEMNTDIHYASHHGPGYFMPSGLNMPHHLPPHAQHYMYQQNPNHYPIQYMQHSPYMMHYQVPVIYNTPNTVDMVMIDPRYNHHASHHMKPANYMPYERAPRKKSHESQESYSSSSSEVDYYPTSNFKKYQDGQKNQSSQGTLGGEKPYSYGKDRPRYDARPKLPPRLQKKRENGFRN